MISRYNSGQSIWLEYHGDQVRYCLRVLDLPPRACTTEVVQLGLLNSMAAPQHVLGPEWKPNLVELAMAPMDLSQHFPQFGDVKVRFNQPFTSLWADRKVLSIPLATWNSGFSQTVNPQDRDALTSFVPASEPLGQLEQAIESQLGDVLEILSPADPERRGCQLSLRLRAGREHGRRLHDHLQNKGVVTDWREPDILRVAPVPLYNRFEDCHEFLRQVDGWAAAGTTARQDFRKSGYT